MRKIKFWMLLIAAILLYFLALIFKAFTNTALSAADAVLSAAEKEAGL